MVKELWLLALSNNCFVGCADCNPDECLASQRTGVLAHYYGPEVADGFFHSFSGWVIYIAAFLLLFGVGWVLDRFRPANERVGAHNS